ncbi:ketopantoate reductase family protein [Thalassotalea ganghwensis]
MNIVVIGQGAVGLLWYHQLAKLHSAISLQCSPRIKAVPKSIKFLNQNQQEEQSACRRSSIEHLRNADLVLCCVKSFDVVNALQPLTTTDNDKAIIVLCHNGLGVLDNMPEQWLKRYTFLAMVTTHGAKRLSPFYVQHTGYGQSDIGLVNGTLTHQRKIELVNVLNNAVEPVLWQNNMLQMQWQKLAINCVINPLTAIDNVNNGVINQAKYRSITRQLLTELVAVAAHQQGVNLTLEVLLTQVKSVAEATAKNTSSMRADILAKRPTEIDAINGYICQLGQKHGIETTAHHQVTQQILALSQASPFCE